MINSQQNPQDKRGDSARPKVDWRMTRDNIDDIARRLDELLRTMGDASGSPQGEEQVGDGLLEAARRDWKLRRERERAFCTILFNPTWDILLDLFIARGEKRQVTTATLSGTLNFSESAVFRCISQLIEQKLVTREEGAPEQGPGKGNVRLALTEKATGLMRDHYDRATQEPGAAAE
jgi:predicted ArsR family transcriptional regulator